MTYIDHPSDDDVDQGEDMLGRTPMTQDAADVLMGFAGFNTETNSKRNPSSPRHAVSEINNSPVPNQIDQNKIHDGFDKTIGTNCEFFLTVKK